MLLSVLIADGFNAEFSHLGRKVHFLLAPLIALAMYQVHFPIRNLLLTIKAGLIIIGIIVIKTNFNPKKILSFTQSLEKRFKRKRAFKNSPRTLDIDIIFIKKGHQHLYINQPNLIVPHPKWFQRNSVLIPLQSLINGV
jgi:hypothetical protein